MVGHGSSSSTYPFDGSFLPATRPVPHVRFLWVNQGSKARNLLWSVVAVSMVWQVEGVDASAHNLSSFKFSE